MTKLTCFLIACTFSYGCMEINSETDCEKKLQGAYTEINNLKTSLAESKMIEPAEIILTEDTLPKNYIKPGNQSKLQYEHGLITLEKSQIIYKGDGNAWLQLTLKNNLNREIKSVLISIHSTDCNNVEDDYIWEDIEIEPNAVESFEIQISLDIETEKIMNCYKHPPDIAITDAFLVNGERYPNTTGRNYYRSE